jgi:muramoyltetrapeptide carboxypeptidase
MSRTPPRKARPLRPGGRIGVCAPAGPVDLPRLLPRVRALEQRGYRTVLAPHLEARHGYLAGSDEERLADLLELLRDPGIDALFLARGGYGTPRLLRSLDPALCARQRKLVVGYSDGTALALFLLRRAGLASLHGPMLERDDQTPEARTRLFAVAAGDRAEALRGARLRAGRAEGLLVGGNLRMLNASLGTPWEIDTTDALLFFEEVGEHPYAIDRSLVQLRDAGKFAACRGVAVGHLVNCESERYPERSACEVVQEFLAAEVDGPVVTGLPFGHVADNRALGVGVLARLDGDAATLELLEPVVEDAD